MYLSLGEAARKQFRDLFPHATLWVLKADKLIQKCTECFLKQRNRTLNRHRFSARMQQSVETLYQFWHVLNALAAPCNFREITKTFVPDIDQNKFQNNCALNQRT